MVDVASQVLFSSLTADGQIIRFQLAMEAWNKEILSERYINATTTQQREFINQWLADFEMKWKANQTRVNLLSARGGAYVASKALKIDILGADEFVSLYRDEMMLFNSVDWAKARQLRNELATRIKDYDKFYAGWEEYLKSAQAAGLSQADKVTKYLNAGGKEFTALKDSAGRLWNPGRYASMYANTRGSEAYDEMTQNAFVSNGGDVVQISNHGTTTPICKQFEGKFYSLTGRTKGLPILQYRPPFHPNCKHIALPMVGRSVDVMQTFNKMKNVEIIEEKQAYSTATLQTINKQKAYLRQNRPTLAGV